MKKIMMMMAVMVMAMSAFLTGCAGDEEAAGTWQEQYPEFRYGVQSVETQGAALTRYRGFSEHVQETLGVELDLYLSSEYSGVIQAIAGGQIEVMDMGASGYAAAWIDTNGQIEPLVVPQESDGSIGYYAVMFVRSDSPYESIEDLEGKSFAWADPNSSSGYLFPLVSLRGMGIEPDDYFGDVVFSGGHEQSIIGVLDGAYDAAVTWTNDIEAHTRGGIHMMLERGVLDADDIRIIWFSDLIPNPVIAIRSDVPQEMKDDLRQMFMNLHIDNPEVFQEVVRGDSPGYVEVEHEVYQIAIDLRQQLQAERRDR